ncbi:phosphate/phosphite/phosphonate ABC transporter substrate-binding protein [Pseudomonas sp. NyZ201]|uniref:phosphate/phosphite/phosphonate ABC transporter substrate-binding protein n=1 Tax=Pseudomonas sp. NyZ201 TaxID=3409857 RepID=UPI003CFA44A2
MAYAELLMYVAPSRVRAASESWLQHTLDLLGGVREDASALDLPTLWQSPNLLFAQTCGYPLMTLLRGKVRVIGRPVYELPHASAGNHCSLLVVREDDPRCTLTDFFDSRGLLNSPDSNSGMNLLRHRLAPLQRDNRFFSAIQYTGGHRDSLKALKAGQGDLAAIDSITWDYLARDRSEEVSGLRILDSSAPSPTLPFIGPAHLDETGAERIRQALNQTLQAFADTLAIREVLPASEADYQILLDYERDAANFKFE